MKQLIQCYLIFWIGFAGYFLLFHFLGWNYYEHYLVIGGYYALAVFVVAKFFWPHLRSHFDYEQKDQLWPLLTLVTVVGIYIFANVFINKLYPISDGLRDLLLSRQFQFAVMSNRVMVPKLVEIMFQQIVILAMTVWLLERGYHRAKLVLGFAIVFGIAHLPLLIVTGPRGLFFVFASVFSALAFPLLIAYFPFGFLYSLSVHITFYIGAGVYFRTIGFEQLLRLFGNG